MRPPKHRMPINLKSLPRSKREVYRQQAFAAFKAGLAERALPADSKAVADAVVEHLSGRKRTPEKVRNLFKKTEVRYAAADVLGEA